MLGRLKRNWVWLLGTACLFAGLWFFHKATLVHERYAREIEATETRWQEIERQLREKIAASQKAPDRLGESRYVSEIISLQTEQYTLQRESLQKTHELYYERYNLTDCYMILTGLGYFLICLGLLLAGRRWRRACLEAQRANLVAAASSAAESSATEVEEEPAPDPRPERDGHGPG
jgi:hypothetical protein